MCRRSQDGLQRRVLQLTSDQSRGLDCPPSSRWWSRVAAIGAQRCTRWRVPHPGYCHAESAPTSHDAILSPLVVRTSAWSPQLLLRCAVTTPI